MRGRWPLTQIELAGPGAPALADWRFLLPLTETSRVLDIRAGGGARVAALAPEVGAVVATEETVEAARLLENRARQGGLDNVMSIAALTAALPFAEGTFDLVILDHVLDREGALSTHKGTREAQLLLLREIRRKLMPGGHLYVGVENRFGFARFFGAAHDSAHPCGRDRPSRSCGLDGYRKLIREAGFASADFYAPLTSHDGGCEWLPLGDATVFDFWATRSLAGSAEFPLKFALARAAFRAGLLPRILPRFAILAHRGGER